MHPDNSKYKIIKSNNSDLLAKEKELDAKFRETSVYKNMKVLLDKKNVQIKELRAKVPDNEDDYLKE